MDNFNETTNHSVAEPESIINLNIMNVLFSGYDCELRGVDLNTQGLKLINVATYRKQEESKYNITIPLTDLLQSFASYGPSSSLLIVRVIPEASTRIKDALSLPASALKDTGSLLITIEFSQRDEEAKSRITYFFNLAGTNNLKMIDYTDARLLIRRICNGPISIEIKEDSEDMSVNLEPTKDDTHDNLPSRQRSRPLPRVQRNSTPSVIDIEVDDDEEEVNEHSEADVVLKYPPDDKDAVTIYRHDLECLKDKEFLNDTMIDFYLKYIHKEVIEPNVAARTHIFSTFFYKRLTKSHPGDKKDIPWSEKFFHRVKNWTKNVNIFENDFLIMPMNKHYHWFLAIICFPGKVTIDLHPAGVSPKLDYHRPCIIYMDSLAQPPPERWSDAIRHFLSKEWEEWMKRKQEVSEIKRSFMRSSMPDMVPPVPSQTNHFDCGLYVLQYVENFLKSPDYVLKKLWGRHKLTDWFPPALIETKRRSIKRVINKLKNECEGGNMVNQNQNSNQVTP